MTIKHKKARDWFREINKLCQFSSLEHPGTKASNSELQRWINQGSVIVNGETLKADELIDFPIFSVVLHPKSRKRRCTLY